MKRRPLDMNRGRARPQDAEQTLTVGMSATPPISRIWSVPAFELLFYAANSGIGKLFNAHRNHRDNFPAQTKSGYSKPPPAT